MAEYAPLTDREAAKLAQDYYSEKAAGATAQEAPTMVLVGGQPGAGKSTAVGAAIADLSRKGGFIHIDADVFHEKVEELKEGRFTSSQTHADCKKIAERVRGHAFEGRRNILEEGLFRHHNSLSGLAGHAREAGYRCELVAMAVSREESRLGVLARRERVRDDSGYVRDVPESKQDLGYGGFTENLLKDAGKFDRVRVMNRESDLLYDSAGGGKRRSVHEALEEGRSLSDKQVAALARQWEELRPDCADRRIPDAELARVDEAIALFNGFKCAEQHRHGMRSLERNARAMADDPRYVGHTEAERLKAAFYRGAAEKKQAFDGKAPDLAAIDAALSSRERLQLLPDVAEARGVALPRGREAETGMVRSLGDGAEIGL
ncbi:MAG: zeta toxin family protein [Azoarcus sp.]|jgi:predicted ABC-type ATPase|nr:zeta toxin family protein [Azoarcus sp.]